MKNLLKLFYKKPATKPSTSFKPHDSELNEPDHQWKIKVNDYFMVEVVAVPPNFEITNHLKMREAAGIFDFSKVDLKQLLIISDAVKETPIFSVLNNPAIDAHACIYFLNIMSELKLIINSVDNPMRRDKGEYITFLKRWDKEKYIFMREDMIQKMNLIIINLIPLYQQQVMDEAVQAVNDVLKHTEEVKKIKESIK